jgi:hypothetical protein
VNAPRKRVERPEMKRVCEIALDHIWFAERHRDHVAKSASLLGVSPQTALALAIADQVAEEFTLTPR